MPSASRVCHVRPAGVTRSRDRPAALCRAARRPAPRVPRTRPATCGDAAPPSSAAPVGPQPAGAARIRRPHLPGRRPRAARRMGGARRSGRWQLFSVLTKLSVAGAFQTPVFGLSAPSFFGFDQNGTRHLVKTEKSCQSMARKGDLKCASPSIFGQNRKKLPRGVRCARGSVRVRGASRAPVWAKTR